MVGKLSLMGLGLAGLLIAAEGNLNSVEARNEYKRTECREGSIVDPAEYDLVMKEHSKELLKIINDEMTIYNYGHLLCEYDGVMQASSADQMEISEKKLDCIYIDDIDINGFPYEWAATMDLDVNYDNGVKGKFHINLYFDELGSTVEISEK